MNKYINISCSDKDIIVTRRQLKILKQEEKVLEAIDKEYLSEYTSDELLFVLSDKGEIDDGY